MAFEGAFARVSLVAALASIFVSGTARADDKIAAEALFRAARDEMRHGEYAAACPKLAESQRLDPAPGTLLNLGECKEHLGLLASAWAAYHEAADGLAGDDRLAIARSKMASIEPRLAHLTIKLAPDAPAGTTIQRDSEPLGAATFGVALPIDGGTHVIAASAPGRETKRYDVSIKDAESREIVVGPGPRGASSGAAPRDGSAGRGVGFVLIGLGAASLAAGTITGLMTIHRKSIVDDNCHDGLCKPDGVTAASEGKTLSTVSTITFIAGGVLAAGGVALVVSASPGGASATVAGAF